MQYRRFQTPDGRHWRVWAMRPAEVLGERRAEERRTVAVDVLADPPVLERRHGAERRTAAEHRPRSLGLPAAWRAGWLVFEEEPSGRRGYAAGPLVRHRLAPVPEDWLRCSEATLVALCERAAHER